MTSSLAEPRASATAWGAEFEARRIEIPAADGVRLATDLFLPVSALPTPVVLLRTYLGRRQHRSEAEGWARHGFACAVQDVRGRFDSAGRFDPYSEAEAEDGRTTANHLANQPWCDGRVVLIGGSYGSFCALAAATSSSRPSPIQAVISSVPARRPVHWVGGVPPILAHIHWWLVHGHGQRPRPELGRWWLANAGDLLSKDSLQSLEFRLPRPLPDAFRHLAEGPDAPPPISDASMAALDLPVLHIGGWHDVFLQHTLEQWQMVGSSAMARPPRGLIIGPYTHELKTHVEACYGERCYGPGSRLALGALQVRWLRSVLDGQDCEPMVHSFHLGENRWAEGNRWPLQPTRDLKLFAAGGNRLRPEPAAGEDGFDHDPNDPFPSRLTPIDDRDLSHRCDRAVYETPPLDQSIRWMGQPVVELWGDSEGAGADWVARLLEVDTSGRILYLGHGLVDASWSLAGRGLDWDSGHVSPHTIPLTAGAVTIPAGHRLRLEITGSLYPSYPLHPGTRTSRCRARRFHHRRQRVHRGPHRPTHLSLPVIATPTEEAR